MCIRTGGEYMMIKDSHLNIALVFFVILLFGLVFPFFIGNTKTFIVLSGSMMPMMMPGDMIIANTVNPDDLKVGDVIAFQDPDGRPNTIVTHRIVSINDSSVSRIFQTKGDANSAPDIFSVPASNVKGELVFVLPVIGYLPGLLKDNKIIYILAIIVPVLLIIVGEIKNIIDYSNHFRARKIEKWNKKTLKKTLHVINGHKLTKIMLISCIILSGLIVPNARLNNQTVIERSDIIRNSGYLPMVYILAHNDYIHRWYGIVPPANETRIKLSENTHEIISIPYILPVYWLLIMANINPCLPIISEVGLYTLLITFITVPLWYKKIVIGKKIRKFDAVGGITWKT
jgi:signal peptidase I